MKVILTTMLPWRNNGLAFLIESFDELVRHCENIDKKIMGLKTCLKVFPYMKCDSSLKNDSKASYKNWHSLVYLFYLISFSN